MHLEYLKYGTGINAMNALSSYRKNKVRIEITKAEFSQENKREDLSYIINDK